MPVDKLRQLAFSVSLQNGVPSGAASRSVLGTGVSRNQEVDVARGSAGSVAAYGTATPGQLMLRWVGGRECELTRPT